MASSLIRAQRIPAHSQSIRLATRSLTTSCTRSSSSSAVPPTKSEPAATQGRKKPRRDGQLFDQRLVLSEAANGDVSYPNLMESHGILDAYSHPTVKAGGEAVSVDKRITFFNSPPPFPRPSRQEIASMGEATAGQQQEPSPIPKYKLHLYPVISKRVVQQTGKGKMASQYVGVIAGNGDGLVGYGSATADPGVASAKAVDQAVRSADAVERFEGRTIWTDMSIKFGATKLVLRPRPRGFGLACNPYLHQVFKAAGIKDISAKVHGSRNGMQIIKAAIMLLHGGGAPVAMGDGVGGHGRREEKRHGIKGQATMERERGRSFVEGGSWM